MAGAESAVHRVLVEKPSIPERLINGSKFIKWPKSDNDVTVQVTLRIDPQGHVIYWQEPGRDTECLEISCIRDTRAGKYAKEPKDSQLIKMVCNSSVPVTEKCLTIVYGVKLVELTFLNFVSVEPEPQQCEWADFLLLLAYHPCTRHVSVQTSFSSSIFRYTRLKLETNQMGEIPVKKLIKVLGGKSRRVDHALLSVGLVTGKRDVSIKPEDFHLTGFKKLLQFCCLRPELDTVFSSLGTGARRMYVSQQKFKEFINTEQRDPKLNEILYPVKTDDQVLEYITNFESNEMFAAKGQLTLEGLDAYLQSDDNLIVEPDRYAEHQSMTAPLSHYFINSSHNTYLTGTQLRSKSSAEIYRQVLLTGCRCVELDCWEGDEEPVINHGFTLCTHVLFREVIEAINESAFKTSPYPVILSFENHVDNPQQQAKMAQYCRDIFGDKLLIDPLSKYPIVSDSCLPPPSEIKYKIIVKNKKQRPSADNSDDEEGRITNLDYEENAKEAGTAMKESKAYEAMSSLVNYVQPVRFKSFDISERRKRCYEISSFTESAALRLLTFYPMDFVRYNRRQMSRIYPKGARVDSSNYMPQIFWNAGCQFVALNFQILDQPMQLNMGLFEFNGSTGYILKPPHMRIKDRQFDPFSKNLDGVVAITLKIKIISGQFLSSSKVSTYVEVDMYGLPADTIRKRFKTKTVEGNSLNPYYNGDEFVFEKVVLPNLATLRIAVMETNGSMLGQRFLPVDALKPGYRYITLRNEGNQPLTMPSIFIHLQVGDYVPPELMEFSEALVNPITYMKEKE
uniref:Phosphoinositide phospholipase C n=1 Tax=Ciona savignyi TaxID=51511 RepID=H2YFI7_CIOSA